MTYFENKYGIHEDDSIREYHKKRRMFAVKNDVLYIADKEVDYSHAEWFKKLGWINEKNDALMATITRGSVEKKGIYFYVGYDFEVNEIAEHEMMIKLPELMEKLNISPETLLFGGKTFVREGTIQPKRSYGQIKNLLN